MIDLDKYDKLKFETDFQEIGQIVNDAYHQSYGYLEQLGIQWEQNIRFYEGDQYIFYNETIKNYEIIPLTKFNDFIPRPVTNLLLPIEQTMTSLLTKTAPNATVAQNSCNEYDSLGAKLAERVKDAKWEMDNEVINHIMSAKIMQLVGTVFRKDYWDPTKGGVQVLPTLEGEKTIPIGDTAVKIMSPFEIIPDKDNGLWFIETSLEPLWWIRAAYCKSGNGYTGVAPEDIKEDKDFTTNMSIRYRLKSSTGMGGRGVGTDSGGVKGHAVLKIGYFAPTESHPKGGMVVFAGGKCLYCNDSPTYDPILESSWHPFSWTFWERHPFRFHGISLFENLVPLQKRINAIDALIILNRMLNVAPQWLIPRGCGIPEGYLNGSPGLQVWFNPVGTSGMVPQRLQGSNLASDVWKERQDLVTQMHMIAGDNEVIQGQRPEGVNTLGGLNLLLEQSYSKFSPLIKGWEKYIEDGQKKKLFLISRKYREERPGFTQRLQAMNKDNLEIEIKSFTGLMIGDNIDVKIESGSTIPKSQIALEQKMLELQGRGLLGDVSPMGNPIANQQFLEEFGVAKFDSETNADVKKAKFVVSVLKGINEGRAAPEDYPPLMVYDNVMIHKKVIEDAMKVPGFVDTQQFFGKKYQEIMAAMPPPMPMLPPGMPGPGGMPPPNLPHGAPQVPQGAQL